MTLRKEATTLSVRGARVHNLKNISLDLPKGKLIVFTGLSGSGKSSLAFDTIYAEGQRRYVESLSAYARQFLGLADKPDVDQIDGLSPTIAINQKALSANPRSTVGTITEIYDYLRLLYARIGQPHCPQCGQPVVKQTIDQIVKRVFAGASGKEVIILAPMVRSQKGEHKKVLEVTQRVGYVRVRIDGDIMTLEEARGLTLDKQKKHSVDIVVDRLEASAGERTRLTESLEAALDLGNGLVMVARAGADDMIFSQHFACPECQVDLPELSPRSFSFNSPYGACPVCTGLGTKLEVDPALIVPNRRLTLAEGAVRPWSRSLATAGWQMDALERMARAEHIPLDVPWQKLTKAQQDAVLSGTGITAGIEFEGVIPNLARRWKETESDYTRSEIEKYMRIQECPSCRGKRLQPVVLGVMVGGKNITAVTALTVRDSRQFFNDLAKPTSTLTKREREIARQILKEISARLTFLENVGLAYLTVDRSAATLSGGEAQRIRLATQIGSALTGVLYVLDEPTIGLHQRDNAKLIVTLKELRDLGNTVIVVEHDEEMIGTADHVVDIGPGAGEHGGAIVAQGTPAEIKRNPKSITGRYLSGKDSVPIPESRRLGSGKNLVVKGASEHNLRNLEVAIPLGTFTCLTGVSGSGKSTLMIDIIAKALTHTFYQSRALPGKHKSINGIEHINKVIHIDQSPIGRTPRSNPATYTGIFTGIRDLFTQVPEAKIRGYKAGRFSFNVKGGRCEACAGDGLVRIEMQFLPDVYVECEVCRGQRYNKEALEIHYRGKNIAEVLNLTVEDGCDFFAKIPALYDKLAVLAEVGLGYMKLGQSATTLSGGEAQRIKLATELSRRATGRTMYLLDEPTTGLHFADVRRLLGVLQKLVDKGNTVLVIEHNLDVIKCADWLIDLGPEGGEDGGQIMAEGTPEQVARVTKSYTGQYLKAILKK